LSIRIFATVCLGLGMLVLHGLAARWLWLVRGQLALEASQKNKTPATEVAQTEYSPHNDADKTVDEPINLPMVNRQTRQLLQVFIAVSAVAGIWLIWLNVLPGYRNVLMHPIWSAAGPLNATAVSESSGLAIGSGVVTISDVLLAVLIVLIAIQISRNIPGLIEVGSLRIASLDAGARYALSTIIRYILLATAIATAFSILGIGWSKVQWLVAALSVGLGFGLQELVANFVSGVLLLFERPVRVGDIVTFDGVTGTVTRVQIRATTVRNWDQQDYLIPNKDLITGRVLNWTLSGQLNRVVIKVGVSRESDPRHVRSVLFQILSEHDKVLKAPGPMVNFDGFGESTLDFAVIAYLGSFDGRVDLINEIRTRILERFREEKIEIAFPQRDIHVRQLPVDGFTKDPTLLRGREN
ncbi:MAG: mechanosensitive ion channel, partial [Planctomycetaceae bacterium]|nr:mechanosensitive ion channel [Planctomycetaceae bacterium]